MSFWKGSKLSDGTGEEMALGSRSQSHAFSVVWFVRCICVLYLGQRQGCPRAGVPSPALFMCFTLSQLLLMHLPS